jgi:hypothetical protein
MASKTKKSKYFRNGLHVVVLSSDDGATEVSHLKKRTDVKHWVTVENLAGYPADVDCRGRIPAPRPVIKFDAVRAGDTATVWTDTFAGLPDSTPQDLGKVTLLPAHTGASGKEIISADVEVFWPQSANKESDTLDIQVST